MNESQFACPRCHQVAAPGARFCVNCGHSLKKIGDSIPLVPCLVFFGITLSVIGVISVFLLKLFPTSTATATAWPTISNQAIDATVAAIIPGGLHWRQIATTAAMRTATAAALQTKGYPTDCKPWYTVSSQDKGKKLCIYGTIVVLDSTRKTPTRFKFSTEPNTFFVYDILHVYPDVSIGECVAAYETVQLFDDIPYMAVKGKGLFYCESWMK